MFENFDDILTVDDVATALKIGTTQVYKLLRSGKLKGYKEGKDWKTARYALENYIKNNLNNLTQKTGNS